MTTKAKTPASKPRPTRNDAQRQSILDAASLLFIEKGFGGTNINDIADAVGVSRRTFSRVFAKHANMTPSAFVDQVRLEFCRKLLEETDLPLKTVAFRCGFHSASHMRTIFAKRLDTSPREYRARFKGAQPVAQAHAAALDWPEIGGDWRERRRFASG